jgi:predicted acetyltransferase
MELRWPDGEMLPSYTEALERGWSPNTLTPTNDEELETIRRGPAQFVESLVNLEATGTVTLPDGSSARRIPGYRKWMWDGEFCGSIGLRWQPGTAELPTHVLGHIGYTVVSWKRRRGYATEALRLLLPEAAAQGLPYVEITTDTDNVASQRVITANGGELVEEFVSPASHGARPTFRYRIAL